MSRAGRARSRPRLARELVARGAWRAHPARPAGLASFLARSQWWPADDLRALQVELLRDTLAAAVRVPFYRQRLREAGLVPEAVRSLDDLHVLPPLERETVQALDVEGLRVPGRHGLLAASSGSVGRPVRSLWPRETISWFEADDRRCNDWLGVRAGAPRLWVAASPSTKLLRRRLSTWATNVTVVASADLVDPELRDAALRTVAGSRPALVWGQANGLYALALAAIEAGADVRAGACWSEGAVLHAHYRPVLEQAFGCRVRERYGCWEVGMIAHECPEEANLHVSSEGCLVEIVRPDGASAAPGELGSVLVTSLRNRAMPLLRYRIGDLAVAPGAAPCPCGRGLPLLGRLVGRENDLLRRADGSLVMPELVSAVMSAAVASVVEFQAVQRADLTVSVQVVQRDRPPPEPYRASIAAAIDRLLGAPGATSIERVEAVPLTGAGKLRHVVSEARVDA